MAVRPWLCPKPYLCDEAQTCQGKCVEMNRLHGSGVESRHALEDGREKPCTARRTGGVRTSVRINEFPSNRRQRTERVPHRSRGSDLPAVQSVQRPTTLQEVTMGEDMAIQTEAGGNEVSDDLKAVPVAPYPIEWVVRCPTCLKEIDVEMFENNSGRYDPSFDGYYGNPFAKCECGELIQAIAVGIEPDFSDADPIKEGV